MRLDFDVFEHRLLYTAVNSGEVRHTYNVTFADIYDTTETWTDEYHIIINTKNGSVQVLDMDEDNAAVEITYLLLKRINWLAA